MKTSNKLLIAFGGWIFAMLLFSAIVLRVNYSKGITNTHKRAPEEAIKIATLQPFRVLVLNGEGASQERVHIQHSDEYGIAGINKEQYQVKGDTLFIRIAGNSNGTLLCPAIETIEAHNTNWDISMSDFKDLPQLSFSSTAAGFARIYNSEIRSLKFSGAQQTSLEVGEDCKVDSADITIQKHGNLYFRPGNKYADIKVDSLNELQISGDALKSIKTIK